MLDLVFPVLHDYILNITTFNQMPLNDAVLVDYNVTQSFHINTMAGNLITYLPPSYFTVVTGYSIFGHEYTQSQSPYPNRGFTHHCVHTTPS